MSNKKHRLTLKIVFGIIAVVGTWAASLTASGACWIWSYYEKDCPKSLLK